MKHLWAVAFVALGSCLTANAQAYRFTDVLSKQNGRWQIVAGQETREKSASAISVEQEITQLEKQFSEAEVHKDIQRMSKLMADDLTDVEDDGSIWTKSDIIKLFESPATVLNRDTISELRIRQDGHIAIVTLLDSADFTVNGRDMGGEFRLTDVWARRDGAWQLVAFHSSKIKKVTEASKGLIAEASSSETSHLEGKKQPHSLRGMQSESSDSVTLKQLEQNWLDAYREGDADKMGKILADDFIGRWADGSTQTKDEQLRAIRTSAEKHSTNQMLECNVRLYGDTAVVTGLQTEQSVLQGRDGSGTYSYTDVFVKRDGRWQVVASETKRVASQTGSRESVRDRVIGTWQLMSAGTFRRDGSFEPYPEYGPNARGYLMYDSTGHMCVSLANPNHPYWVNAEKPTDAEKVRSYDVFFAYCGTYEIREKEGRIIHRPEMGSWPHYVGTDQNRNFRLEGNRLILSAEETPPNGEHRRYQITWQRVSLPTYAAQEGSDEQTIVELEQQWAKSEEAFDEKALGRILAEDFVSMDEKGHIRSKVQEIASVREWNPPGPEAVDEMSVRVVGDTAIALGRFTWMDRRSGSVKLQGRFVDTFLRRDGRWQVVANSYVRTDGQAH